mgnify:FL=1
MEYQAQPFDIAVIGAGHAGVEAALAAPDEVKAVLDAAALVAADGAKASEGFVSKFGRARSYKEQTIGTPDAGAVSTALFFAGMASAIR